jgi:hypothetical protein
MLLDGKGAIGGVEVSESREKRSRRAAARRNGSVNWKADCLSLLMSSCGCEQAASSKIAA